VWTDDCDVEIVLLLKNKRGMFRVKKERNYERMIGGEEKKEWSFKKKNVRIKVDI